MSSALLRWVGRLRFPYLLALVGSLFLIDLVIPDAIPLLDEILLGSLTLLLSTWKRRRGEPRGR
jgi:hypothetical protein